jgi:hypothetical protein
MINRGVVHRFVSPPTLPGPDDAAWSEAQPLTIDQFRPEGSAHQPQTSLQLLHDDQSVHGLFRVRDQFVRCRHEAYGDPVYKDSCVEFFIQPKAGGGYFNFEFNCGGAFLCSYITDEARTPAGFKAAVKLTAAEVSAVRVRTSLPRIVEPEIAAPVDWWLAFSIPARVAEQFIGPLGPLSGQMWRGNAYKCGDETSHPHWAAWSAVDQLNFHLPHCFGELWFE